MDQLILVSSGTLVIVIFYVMSPVRLSDWLLGKIEQFGRSNADAHAGEPDKGRSFYVRDGK